MTYRLTLHGLILYKIFAARPMFPQIQTTPLAGSQLTSHLKNLLLMFATYLPPATTLNSTTIPARRATRIPQEVLTDSVVEEIKSRCCFVGEPLRTEKEKQNNPVAPADDERSEMDFPPSDTSYADSEFSHDEPESEGAPISDTKSTQPEDNQMETLAAVYRRHSIATDIEMRVAPPPSQEYGTGRGTLIIPGWVRERAAELLFAGGDIDESSLAETILDALLKVPRDLRKTMASSILVSGGTAMLPGFIPRLHTEIVNAVAPPLTPHRHQTRPDRPDPPLYDKYGPLRPLLPYFAILNNPTPPPVTSERAAANAGKAPAFAPACLAWVGGSLAGCVVCSLCCAIQVIEFTTDLSRQEVLKYRANDGTKRRRRMSGTTIWMFLLTRKLSLRGVFSPTGHVPHYRRALRLRTYAWR